MTEGHVRPEKARGAFFTPAEITRFISDWAVRGPSDRVLEPSCGEAAFLLAAGDRLRAIGAGLFTEDLLRGVELHEPSAEAAESILRGAGLPARVDAGDFFDFEPSKKFDAIVGNPPYVRYHGFSGESRAKARGAALAEGVRLSGLASSWAAFVVHAARFLEDDGRLGLVLPAELLTVHYAAPLRSYLLKRFGRLKLVMFEERVFPGVEEEVVLLLAEGRGPSLHFELYQAQNATELASPDAKGWTRFVPEGEEKWTPALLDGPDLEIYERVTALEGFATLAEWGTTYLGIVTGNNRYFTLTADEVNERGIPMDELLRISPPGSRHLRGLTFTNATWRELTSQEKACFMLYPKDEPTDVVASYIAAGEETGVHRGYKCRNRSPWWRVPLVPVPDLLLTYMDQERPRLITNRARVRHLNSLYGVTLNRGVKRLGMDLLPLGALNSLTLLGAEIVGRAYGGGLLKLEPREADRLPLPSPELLADLGEDLRALRPQLSVSMRKGDLSGAVQMVDRLILRKGMGLPFAEIESLRSSRQALFGRRLARANRSV